MNEPDYNCLKCDSTDVEWDVDADGYPSSVCHNCLESDLIEEGPQVSGSTLQPVQAARCDWRTEAACRRSTDELEVNWTISKLKQAKQAERGKAICAGCPVLAECAVWLASHAEDPCPWHVVAGLAPLERQHLWSINSGRSGGTNGGRPRGVLVCGTEAGWYRHRRWEGMPVTCVACIEARRDAEAARKRVRFAAAEVHGSDAAYARHRRKGETACDECKRAHAMKWLERKGAPPGSATRGRPPADRQHGTYTGYTQHTRRGEVPCDDCREARNEYVRIRRSRGAA